MNIGFRGICLIIIMRGSDRGDEPRHSVDVNVSYTEVWKPLWLDFHTAERCAPTVTYVFIFCKTLVNYASLFIFFISFKLTSCSQSSNWHKQLIKDFRSSGLFQCSFIGKTFHESIVLIVAVSKTQQLHVACLPSTDRQPDDWLCWFMKIITLFCVIAAILSFISPFMAETKPSGLLLLTILKRRERKKRQDCFLWLCWNNSKHLVIVGGRSSHIDRVYSNMKHEIE